MENYFHVISLFCLFAFLFLLSSFPLIFADYCIPLQKLWNLCREKSSMTNFLLFFVYVILYAKFFLYKTRYLFTSYASIHSI